MRTDIDLEFLQYCSNTELRELCDMLTHDEEGNIRFSEKLTEKDSYIENYPDNCKSLWKDIAMELQLFGGNTFANIFRHGHGPAYESIVYDVCKEMEVENIDEHDTAEDMEKALLDKVTEKMLDELTYEQRKQVMKDLNIKHRTYNKQAVMAALLLTRRINLRLYNYVMSYILRMVTQLLIGRGVLTAGFGLLSRGLGIMMGPVGWIVLSGWTAWDIAGPAYRVTVPAVIQVAFLRMKYNAKCLTDNYECV